ncbi:MAG: DUF4153 domain-containing protein [Planctomycetota bacterium]|nr:DUF4153 domain-containing protein [Planctomycetota bacterium]
MMFNPDTPPETDSGRTPITTPPVRAVEVMRARELLSVVVVMCLADVTLFRGAGFAGWAVLLLSLPPLLHLGSPAHRPLRSTWAFAAAIAILCARLAWLGSPFTVCCGLGLLCIFALGRAGRTVHVLESFAFAWCVIPSGILGLAPYWKQFQHLAPRISPRWLNVVLPFFALVLFGFLFVGANPDLARAVSDSLNRWINQLEQWLIHTSPAEVLFLCFIAIVTVGLLRPVATLQELRDSGAQQRVKPGTTSFFYTPCRNTMMTVVVLFAIYLVFEFQTLWFREFPIGFYYSGYAHQGAAWLTVALMAATGILSLIFRGDLLADPRRGRLYVLAWIWSLENLVLGMAVLNRLFIYIQFNGMTRMRIVGLFGIATVIAGFLLVVVKIIQTRSFLWLLRAHLITLAAACYLYGLAPIDWFSTSYNVRRILSGDLAPAVQLSVHPLNPEGISQITPLTEHPNPIIAAGVRALLANAYSRYEPPGGQSPADNWSDYQLAHQWLLGHLQAHRERWQTHYRDETRRQADQQRFVDFVYQWY